KSMLTPELVAELVGLKVDVLAALSTPVAVAAKNATQTIPIVMMAIDPVGLGLIGSLSRPGGNVTGLSYLSGEIIAKRLQLLKELVPGLARAGVLRNPLAPSHPIHQPDQVHSTRPLTQKPSYWPRAGPGCWA